MKNELITRLRYDFSRLLNKVSFIYEEFEENEVCTDSVTSLLHTVTRLCWVCTESVFKILLLDAGETLEVQSRKGLIRTISCQQAFDRCRQLHLVKMSPASAQTMLELIRLRNMSQHLPLDFRDNLAQVLYTCVLCMDVICKAVEPVLDPRLANLAKAYDDSYQVLLREAQDPNQDLGSQVRLHKGAGGQVRFCYNCGHWFVLLSTIASDGTCASCGLEGAERNCIFDGCAGRQWFPKDHRYAICTDHMIKILDRKESDLEFQEELDRVHAQLACV